MAIAFGFITIFTAVDNFIAQHRQGRPGWTLAGPSGCPAAFITGPAIAAAIIN